MPPTDHDPQTGAPAERAGEAPETTPAAPTYKFRSCLEDPFYLWLCADKKRRYRRGRRHIDNARRRQRRATDPDYRDRVRARKYGLTLEEFRAILARQGGVCAICKRDGRRLCVDHCHATGKVRGFLCNTCNTGLGCYEDNPEFMRAASVYLENAMRKP